MMVGTLRICYFARFRERLATDHEELPLQAPITVAEVLQQLAARGEAWSCLFAGEDTRVMVAVNQTMATLATQVQAGDELALFPPVTGG